MAQILVGKTWSERIYLKHSDAVGGNDISKTEAEQDFKTYGLNASEEKD